MITCNEPEFAALPPGQIVPILANRGLISDRNAVFTGCCTLTDRLTGRVEHGHHKNQEPFHD